jgi:hypothetical protein
MPKTRCIQCGTDMYATEPSCPQCGALQVAPTPAVLPDPDPVSAVYSDPQERLITILKWTAFPALALIALYSIYMGDVSANSLRNFLLFMALVYTVFFMVRAKQSGAWSLSMRSLAAVVGALAVIYIVLGPYSPVFRWRVASQITEALRLRSNSRRTAVAFDGAREPGLPKNIQFKGVGTGKLERTSNGRSRLATKRRLGAEAVNSKEVSVWLFTADMMDADNYTVSKAEIQYEVNSGLLAMDFVSPRDPAKVLESMNSGPR